jgi:hypothetical protein
MSPKVLEASTNPPLPVLHIEAAETFGELQTIPRALVFKISAMTEETRDEKLQGVC